MPESMGPTAASSLLPAMRAKNIVSFTRKLIESPVYRKISKSLSNQDSTATGSIIRTDAGLGMEARRKKIK